MRTEKVDLGEYKVLIDYDDSGNGHIIVTVLDEGEEPIEGIEIRNSVDEDKDE